MAVWGCVDAASSAARAPSNPYRGTVVEVDSRLVSVYGAILGSFLVGISMDVVDRDLLVYFMGVDACKFRRKVVPGDVLELHVDVKRGGGKIWKFAGRATVGGELACEAEFTAMMDLRD